MSEWPRCEQCGRELAEVRTGWLRCFVCWPEERPAKACLRLVETT